jgi:hypothetical protein
MKKPVKHMKKPQKAIAVSAKKKQPSKAKAEVRGVYSAAENQAALPDISNKRSEVILIAAIGDAFLPVEDFRVELIIQQREKMKAEQKSLLQGKWGVTPEESHKAVESGWLALRREFLDAMCGGEFGGDNTARENWIITCFKHDPARLFKLYLQDPALAERAARRGKDFYSYVGQIADSIKGRDKLFAPMKGFKPLVKWFILAYWSEGPRRDLPPICLWTNSSIIHLLGGNSCADEISDEAALRQAKRRWQLSKPKRSYSVLADAKGRFTLYRK